MKQASYLKGGPLMWMLPLYLHVNQKSDYDDMECLYKEGGLYLCSLIKAAFTQSYQTLYRVHSG